MYKGELPSREQDTEVSIAMLSLEDRYDFKMNLKQIFLKKKEIGKKALLSI